MLGAGEIVFSKEESPNGLSNNKWTELNLQNKIFQEQVGVMGRVGGRKGKGEM